MGYYNQDQLRPPSLTDSPVGEERQAQVLQQSTGGLWKTVTEGAKRFDEGFRQSTKSGIAGDIFSVLGAGGIFNPYVATGVSVMKLVGSMYQNRAIMAEARNNARHLREQGQQALRQAERQAEDVKEEEQFKAADEARQLRNTGFLSGSESFAKGTGVGSVFEANRQAAETLAQDIMSEAEKQKQQYDLAAQAQIDAANERRKGNVLGRIAKNIPIIKDL